MTDRTMFPKAAADAIGVSVDTVGRYAREGLIPFATTPKGHRRFNLDEVRAAIADLRGSQLTRLRTSAETPPRAMLIPGPAVRVSASSRLREDVRATRTGVRGGRASEAQVQDASPVTALDDVLDHARRVLVATGR
ncbi:MAG: helix-turn-helix domain-containing protein [Dermatophilaceae bacterium]